MQTYTAQTYSISTLIYKYITVPFEMFSESGVLRIFNMLYMCEEKTNQINCRLPELVMLSQMTEYW